MGVKPTDNKSTDKTTVLSPTPDFSSHIENASVVLLAVPEQSAVLTGKIKFILVNALGGQIQGACFEKRKNKLNRISIFSLSTNQQSELFEFTREQLMSFDSLVISYVYSDNDMFSSGSKELTIEYPGLVQLFPKLTAPFCFACSHEIYKTANSSEDLPLDLLKDKYNPTSNPKIKSSEQASRSESKKVRRQFAKEVWFVGSE